MKKNFAVMLLTVGIIFCSQLATIENVSAENERYVGTFKDGYDAYMVINTWEVVNPKDLSFKGAVRAVKGNNSFLIWYNCWTDGKHFYYKNSQGFSGIVNQYKTPVVWRIYKENLSAFARAIENNY